MFSGRPSVPPSVRPCVRASVIHVVGIYVIKVRFILYKNIPSMADDRSFSVPDYITGGLTIRKNRFRQTPHRGPVTAVLAITRFL